MPLRDVFNKLKTTIVGTNTSDIDSKLDSAVTDITAYRSQIGRNGYIELVKNLISKTGMEIPTSFAQSTTVTPAALGQGTRLMRYKTYEGIVGNINYCHRALSVLTDSILAPDDITKTTLEINPTTFLEGEKNVDSDVRNCKDLIEKLKIESALDIVVKNTLQFGDFFAEVADAKTALTSRSAILTETYYSEKKTSQESFIAEGADNSKLKVILDYSSMEDEKKETNLNKKEKKADLSDVHLLYYEPKRVVKLQSDMFPVCFGYLVFPQAILNPALMIQNQMVNSICQNVLTSLAKKIPNLTQDTVNTNDLKDIITTMVRESDPSRSMNIRYVPPNKMQHFFVPSTKFYPYGESIFDPNVFTAKLVIALETALVIFRLNRSTEKRKISVEVGLPRDARKAIEKIKEEFRKRKVSIDSLGTVDTIPSQITTFEDIYLPSKDGKNYVDVTSFGEGMVDTRGKVDEIKMLRDQLVASLGVPASFLGIEENLCLISNTYIPLINGLKLKLSEIIEQFDKGVSDMYVYSYDHETGRVVPAKITWAGYTKLQTNLIRVHLDNDKYIDCTPEHPFMMRDGSYKEAQYLEENDSLMPLYRKNSKSTISSGLSYEYVYHPGLKKKNWQFTYHMVSEYINGPSKKGYVIHHLDYNPRNNHPDNLVLITNIEHHSIHGNDECKHTNKGTLYIEDNCIICGKEFTRSHSINQITCSIECRQERKRLDGLKSWELRLVNFKEYDFYCAICGKQIESKTLTPERFNEESEKCLSCDSDFCRSHIRAFANLTNKGTKLSSEIQYRSCEICNESYLYSEDKIQRKKIKLTNICGKTKCINTILGRRAANNKKERANTLKFNCPYCGDEFERAQWYYNSLKDSSNMTCGKKECMSKTFSKSQKIIHNTNYIYQQNNIQTQSILNHKVIRIEILEGLHDTGDITVEKYHNFAVEAGVIVHNSNKSALTEENVMFARTIVNNQKYFTKQINELIKKIYELVDPEKALTIMDHVNVALPPPKSLQFEREAAYLSQLANLVQTLEGIGVPKEWAKKKYLTSIDWDEVKKFEIDSKIDTSLNINPAEDPNAMGGMGGMPMGGAGMGGF